MKKLLLAAVLALAAIAMVVTVAIAKNGNGHNGKSLHAHLDGYQEVPTLSVPSDGKLKVKIRSGSVDYKLSYEDLTSPVRFAHIHFGRPAVNGGVIAFLCGGGGKPACPQSGEVTGTIVPADVVGPADQGIAPGEFDEFVRALKAGATYGNVHTEGFGSGEIRGQIGGHGNKHRGWDFSRGHDGDGKGHDGDRKGHDRD